MSRKSDKLPEKRRAPPAPIDRPRGPLSHPPAARCKGLLSSDRWDALSLGIVFGVALVLRIVFLLQARGSPFFIPFDRMLDPFIYDAWAQRIAGGDWLGSGVFYAMPLYPYLLGIAYWVFGRDVFLATLLQSLLGCATCLLVYAMARILFDRWVAVLAGLCTACYSVLIFYGGMLAGTTVTIFLNCALLALLVRRAHGAGWKAGLAAGLLTGLSLMTSGSIAPFIPCLVLWSFATAGRRRGLIFSALLILGITLIVMPVTARNVLMEGEFVFITAHGGINFYIGNNPETEGAFSPPGATHTGAGDLIVRSRVIAENDLGRKLTASEVSSYWFARGFGFIRAQPGRYVALLVNKFRLYWSATEISDIVEFEFFKRYIPLLKLPLPTFAIVAPLAIAGLVIGVGEWRKLLILYLFILSQMLSCLIFFVNSRYRLSVVPVLIIFASSAVCWAVRRLTKKDVISAILFIVLLVVGVRLTVFFVNAPPRFSVVTVMIFFGFYALVGGIIWQLRKGIRSELLFLIPLLLGVGLTQSKEVVLAISVSHYNAGNAYRAVGMEDKALEEYRAALRLDPGIPGARVNIGLIYESKGLAERAEGVYLEELEIAPDSVEAYNNLGNICSRSGRLEEAEEHYFRAIELGPPNASVHNNLGGVYARQGRLDKAMEELRKALEIDPGLNRARENMRRLEKIRENAAAPNGGERWAVGEGSRSLLAH